jgi:hypothetical protein
MKVLPFHSPVRGLALEDLWHNNDECEIGLSIKQSDRLPGRARVPKQCPYCQVLNHPRPRITTW